MMKENSYVTKGSIYLVNLGCERNGNVQNGGKTGVRPCLVMNNKIACIYSPVLLVVPITSSTVKIHKHIPTHLIIDEGLTRKSVAMFEQIITVNRSQLLTKICTLSDELMEKANQKIEIAFGLCPTFI
ncbi:MAG: type II toxin-antitoxin system PemK/MazF family toxin [Clostridia bacterium]|nr:type II toxin-antitoxin system PemK/MazF family toxin [Clostridia bacterium]